MGRLKNATANEEGRQLKLQNIFSSPILVGAVLAYLVSLSVFVLASLLFAYTPLPEIVLPYMTYIASLISIFIGGLYSGGKIGQQGWKNGGFTGLIYFVGLFLLSFFLGTQIVYGLQLLLRAVMAFVIGSIGGIVGVNIR